MGRGKCYLEESHEKQEKTVWTREQEKCGGDGGCRAGATDGGRRDLRAHCSKLAHTGEQGETSGNDTEQIFLQRQGADARGAGAPQAIEREADGGAKEDRGNGQGLRVSIQPGGHFTRRAGGLGGRGKQMLPVF